MRMEGFAVIADSSRTGAVPYTIVITEKGGKPRSEIFEQNEITVGRVQGNDIVLPKGNISKRHSRIVLRDGKFIIVDLKSTNGTFVNGKRISSPQVLKDADKIYIGDFTLQLEAKEGEPSAATPSPPSALGASDEPLPEADDELFPEPSVASDRPAGLLDEPLAPPPPSPPTPALRPKEPPPRPSQGSPFGGNGGNGLSLDIEARPLPKPARGGSPPREMPREMQREAQREVRDAQRPSLQPELPAQPAMQARAAVFLSVAKNVPLAENGLPPDDDATLERVRTAAEKVFATQPKRLQGVNAEDWARQIAREVCGLGPLTELLEDPSILEIFVNGPHQLLVRRGPAASSIGVPLIPIAAFFSSEEAVALAVRRIMHTAGLKFDAEHPIAECRMADGTRVNAVHHAAAVRGPLVTISRTSTRHATFGDLVGENVLSRGMADFLELCVRARRNICICGGPGAGAGTLLSALTATIGDDERIVTVEQVARLKLSQPHVITLEPRPLKGGPSAASMRELVANALRMRPDRVVVHEVNGGEALELSVAMAGRQDGTMFTMYASTARDALARLETMIRMAGLDVQSKVVREQIAGSVDVVVSMTRFADGSVRVAQIAEVTGVEVDLVTTQDIFTFKRERFDQNGAVVGRFVATGTAPRFYEELQRRGDAVDLSIFRD
jgi:pilus assembly protein CpaF